MLCDQFSELSNKLKEYSQKAEDCRLKLVEVYKEVDKSQLKIKELEEKILCLEKDQTTGQEEFNQSKELSKLRKSNKILT